MNSPVLYENDELFVFNKTSHTHSCRGKDLEHLNLQDLAEAHFPNCAHLKDSGLLHRLDFETSGCLAVAKTSEALEYWFPLFRKPSDEVSKMYWAILPDGPKQGDFSLYFSSRYRSSKKASVSRTGTEKELGKCRFKKIQNFEKQHSIYEVELIGPGKRHQIRAGFAFLGQPLWNDQLYGSKINSNFFGLHSRSLKLGNIEVSAPSPWPNQILT